MKIFKFGGASVKSAEAARNVVSIVKKFSGEKLVIVVSAMGKTTNSLERLVDSYFHRKKNVAEIFSEIKEYHSSISKILFPDPDDPVHAEVNNLWVEIDWILEEDPSRAYDFIYDQVVPAGELVSSKIISALLNKEGIACSWFDARDCVSTDDNFRQAKPDWTLTQKKSDTIILPLLSSCNVALTQGFIGSTAENYSTTLGREGSDYTAAILAFCLDADEVVIWKDVPGVLNADPKYFQDVKKLDQVSYQDAIELAYYGASVIHPKTIQPLQNKNIPLSVKSFVSPSDQGTLISAESHTEPGFPSYIFKDQQALISISAIDFSFIVEENLSDIFSVFAKHKMKINLMQNSAITFSVCMDDNPEKIHALVDDLRKDFKVLYNENLKLLTIRHYDDAIIEKLTKGKLILVEQRSRHTLQVVMKD